MIYVVPNYCFLVANYTLTTEALSFTDATLFLTEIHTVFCTAITDTFGMCENCPFGKFQQSFHLGCQDSVSFVQLNGERREDVVSGLFSCKDLMLCSQQLFEAHIKTHGGRMLFENEFSKHFQFCVSTQW